MRISDIIWIKFKKNKRQKIAKMGKKHENTLLIFVVMIRKSKGTNLTLQENLSLEREMLSQIFLVRTVSSQRLARYFTK